MCENANQNRNAKQFHSRMRTNESMPRVEHGDAGELIKYYAVFMVMDNTLCFMACHILSLGGTDECVWISLVRSMKVLKIIDTEILKRYQ